MKSYYQSIDQKFILYHGDSVECLKEIGTKCDMIFADPPYFLSRGYSSRINGEWKQFEKGEWDRTRSIKDINTFNYKWLSLCRNILKEDGTIWVSGTYHNIFSVATCLVTLGFKVLNIIVWHKTDAKPTLSKNYFNFTTEYLVWARKNEKIPHYFNCDLMQQINGGSRMGDVWNIPFVSSWEMKLGKHPTQKPLRLLYRIILSSTRKGETIIDPFSGSGTTGIAANLLGRKFIGIDQSNEFLNYSIKRKKEIEDANNAEIIRKKMSENPLELMVIVNHARKDLRLQMIDKGICYLRAGDSNGSVLITPGFERLQYVLLHTNGNDCQLFKLRTKGKFQIWNKESLEKCGFQPQNASYYIVLHFDGTKPVTIKHKPNLLQGLNTYRVKLKPLSDFIGIK